MKSERPFESWVLQFRKGLAETAILAAIRQLGEAYGYQLVQFLSEQPGLEFTEATVYPLLARLTKEGHLTTVQTSSPSGPPRRYYRITKSGHVLLESMLMHWAVLSKSIQSVSKHDKR